MQEYSTALSQEHLKMLEEGSGIAPEVIAERGYRTCTGYSELKSLGITVRRDTDTHGLLLPLYTVAGKPGETYIAKEDRVVPLMVYRPDTPQIDQEGQPQKYLYPGTQRSRLDCHPRAFPRLGDPTVPLWITEGTKKADSLITQGLCALALLGVWNWRGTTAAGGKMALPDWHEVALNGRDVRIVYDSDIVEKASVAHALVALSGMLTAKGAHVHVAYLPSADGRKVGVDDYLLTRPVADLERLLEAPRLLRRGTTPMVQALPTLKLTEKGQPRPVVSNILEILTHDPRWVGVFGYDEFSQQANLITRPPYLSETDGWTIRPIADHDDTETSNWLQREYDLCAATPLVAESMQTLARRHPYHPVRDYLAGLQWDGTARLDTWLITYCHAEDTPYTRAVGPKTLMSGVARVEAPGCKADCVPIAQGLQGTLKSTMWRVLASDAWFSDTLPDIDTKDAMQALQGKWIIELGELAVLQRNEVEAIKRFVSATHDHYRPTYGRHAATVPRHNVFVASTNKDTYFKDETGNRRFWPIPMAGPCDTEALQRDRDQLWAEAYARYQAGELWHLTPQEEELAAEEQAKRIEVDDWEESVLEYVEGKNRVTTKAIMVEQFLWENPALWTQANSKRLGAILRRHGWQHKPYRDDAGKLIKGYQRVTDPIGNTAVTGNTVTSNKNNAVTDVTDVTPLYKNESSKREEEGKKEGSARIYIIGDRGTTGNTGNIGNSPQGEIVPVVLSGAALNGAEFDCLPPPCSHPETSTETMADGSMLIRCLTCRYRSATPPERS